MNIQKKEYFERIKNIKNHKESNLNNRSNSTIRDLSFILGGDFKKNIGEPLGQNIKGEFGGTLKIEGNEFGNDYNSKFLGQNSEFIYHDKSKYSKGIKINKSEGLIDRLLKSINMVKEVLQYNLQLRIQVQELNEEIDQQKIELFHLRCENEDQKDKISILLGMNNSQSIFCSQVDPSVVKRINVVDEIHNLKKDKAILEQRVQFLEIENEKYRNKNELCPLLPMKKNTFIYTENKPTRITSNKFNINNEIIDGKNPINADNHKIIKQNNYSAQRGVGDLKINKKTNIYRNSTLEKMESINKGSWYNDKKSLNIIRKRCISPLKISPQKK